MTRGVTVTEQVPLGTVRAVRASAASGSPYEATIGFSRAVRVGDRIAVSGTAPVWPDGHVDPDPLVQARRCWEIALTALGRAGWHAGRCRAHPDVHHRPGRRRRRRPGPRRALRVDPPGEHDGHRRRTARRALGRRGRARRLRRCKRSVEHRDAATSCSSATSASERVGRAPGTSDWHDSTTDQLPTRRPAGLRAGGHPHARLGHHGSGRWRGVRRVSPTLPIPVPVRRNGSSSPLAPTAPRCRARSTKAQSDRYVLRARPGRR